MRETRITNSHRRNTPAGSLSLVSPTKPTFSIIQICRL